MTKCIIGQLMPKKLTSSYLRNEYLKAEAQAKSSNERIELISWLQEAAAAHWDLTGHRVCIGNIKEI